MAEQWCNRRLNCDSEGAAIIQHIHFTAQGGSGDPLEQDRAVFDGSDSATGLLRSGDDESLQLRPLLSIEDVVLFRDASKPIGQCR